MSVIVIWIMPRIQLFFIYDLYFLHPFFLKEFFFLIADKTKLFVNTPLCRYIRIRKTRGSNRQVFAFSMNNYTILVVVGDEGSNALRPTFLQGLINN